MKTIATIKAEEPVNLYEVMSDLMDGKLGIIGLGEGRVAIMKMGEQ